MLCSDKESGGGGGYRQVVHVFITIWDSAPHYSIRHCGFLDEYLEIALVQMQPKYAQGSL